MLQNLISERNFHARAAKNLLAEKGSSRWSPSDQVHYDTLTASAERIEHRISAHMQQREGLAAYFRTGDESPLITATQRAIIRAAMTTTTPSQGGYTVGAEVARELVDRIQGYGWMRRVATEFTTAKGDSLSIPTSDGTSEQGEIVAQNAQASSQDITFGSAPVPTFRFSSKLITVPTELLQDSAIDLVGFIYKRIRDRIGRTQNQSFTIGDGTTGPQGVFTAASVGVTGSTGEASSVSYDDLENLVETVDEGYLSMPDPEGGSCVGWMMSQGGRKMVRKLKDGNGRPIWVPGDSDGDDIGPPTLLDYPVFINSDAPAPGAGNKSIAFGDLARYWIRDALDVQVLRLDDSALATKGQVGFLGFMRSGGNLIDTGAIKLFQHSAT